MREPKVGEIWQCKVAHKLGMLAFEYITKVEDDTVFVRPVGHDGGCAHMLAISMKGFLRGYFYVQ